MKKSSTPAPTRIISKLLSFYYGNPTKDLKLIFIASDTPSPLPALIHSILTTSGEKSATLSARSLTSLHRSLSKAWKSGANFVIMSAPAEILHDLPLHTLIVDHLATPTALSSISSTPSFLVLNRDDTSYPSLKDSAPSATTKTFGHHRESSTRIDSFKPYKTAIEARLTIGSKIIDVASYITGDTAPSTLAAAATVADLLSLDKDIIIDGLAAYDPPKQP